MSLALAAAVTGLVVVPFGAVTDLLKPNEPYFGFDVQGPVLTLVRAQKVDFPKCGMSGPCACSAWASALVSPPAEFSPLKKTEASAWARWEPWNDSDRDAVEDCDSFPCKVKFDANEVGEMAKVHGKRERFNEFLALVAKRAEKYEKTQVRGPYEFPGNPVDPWALFESHGFKPKSVKLPKHPSLFVRMLDLAPGKMRPLRQILDRRAARTSKGTEAVVWTRDAYTDHYFDGWGEWASEMCDPLGGHVVVVQALVAELDLLKKNDLASRLARGKFKSNFEDRAKELLNRQFGEWQTRVATPAPSPTKKK